MWVDDSGEDQNLLLCILATKPRKCIWRELRFVLELTSCHSREPRLLLTYQEYDHTTVKLHRSRATIPRERSCSHHVVDIYQLLACLAEVNVVNDHFHPGVICVPAVVHIAIKHLKDSTKAYEDGFLPSFY